MKPRQHQDILAPAAINMIHVSWCGLGFKWTLWGLGWESSESVLVHHHFMPHAGFASYILSYFQSICDLFISDLWQIWGSQCLIMLGCLVMVTSLNCWSHDCFSCAFDQTTCILHMSPGLQQRRVSIIYCSVKCCQNLLPELNVPHAVSLNIK